MINVLIADDHAVVREGIKRILADADDIELIAEAADGAELLRHMHSKDVEVVVMDLAMPGMSGLEVLAALREQYPDTPVLVLSMHAEDQYAVRCLMGGASGYLNKGDSPGNLVEAIRTVYAGQKYITPQVAQRLASHVESAAARPAHELLSNREYQVVCMIAAGKSVGDIARELSLSVKTVSTFRSRILEKLGLRHNTEIIRYALDHGLIE